MLTNCKNVDKFMTFLWVNEPYRNIDIFLFYPLLIKLALLTFSIINLLKQSLQ